MRRTPIASVLFLASVAVAACGGPAPAVSPTAGVVATPTAETAPSASSRPSSPSPAASAAADLALLDTLPADIQGVALMRDLETTAEIIAGGRLAPQVDALAVGVYLGPGSSPSDDLAIANVARLRPGTFTDTWFRSWRDTYNEGACETSGGVAAGVAETEIGGRTTHIGSCIGGVHTYHVHLTGPDRVVSITALGEARFGERVVAGLTE